MNNTEFVNYLDNEIKNEMLLGGARSDNRLQGLRNIKSDFNYIWSNNPKLEAIEIVRKLYSERLDNEKLYQNAKKIELWLQEKVEREILEKFLPKEPKLDEVLEFLNTLDIPKQKSSFKKFQDACFEKFGQKINSQIILDFITKN